MDTDGQFTLSALTRFASAYNASGCATTAYRQAFRARGDKCARLGALLLGRADVQALIAADLQGNIERAGLGAPPAGAADPRAPGAADPRARTAEMLEIVYQLAHGASSEANRLRAAERYDQLLQRYQALEVREDVPAELRAFIDAECYART